MGARPLGLTVAQFLFQHSAPRCTEVSEEPNDAQATQGPHQPQGAHHAKGARTLASAQLEAPKLNPKSPNKSAKSIPIPVIQVYPRGPPRSQFANPPVMLGYGYAWLG